jgi:hypothetical protein
MVEEGSAAAAGMVEEGSAAAAGMVEEGSAAAAGMVEDRRRKPPVIISGVQLVADGRLQLGPQVWRLGQDKRAYNVDVIVEKDAAEDGKHQYCHCRRDVDCSPALYSQSVEGHEVDCPQSAGLGCSLNDTCQH